MSQSREIKPKKMTLEVLESMVKTQLLDPASRELLIDIMLVAAQWSDPAVLAGILSRFVEDGPTEEDLRVILEDSRLPDLQDKPWARFRLSGGYIEIDKSMVGQTLTQSMETMVDADGISGYAYRYQMSDDGITWRDLPEDKS